MMRGLLSAKRFRVFLFFFFFSNPNVFDRVVVRYNAIDSDECLATGFPSFCDKRAKKKQKKKKKQRTIVVQFP